MKKFIDVIIIGAGPAGCMAGYYLAKAGLNVLMIEKATFPRRKICGGGLTHHAYCEIPFDITPVIQQQVTWGHLGLRGHKIATIRHDKPIAYLIERASFDDFLLKQALSQGAECVQGERFISLSEHNGLISIQTNQGERSCRYLIGADGVHSQVARRLGLCSLHEVSLAYEARLELPQNHNMPLIDSITFDFGTLLWGYGWIFPKRDHINVGVFRSWPGKRTSRRQLLRFIHQHPTLRHLPVRDIRAFPGPLGGKKQTLHKHNMLLAGDASNLVDPWLGEGLYYALASGRMAAESILYSEKEKTPDLSLYSRKVHEIFLPQLVSARKLSLAINMLPLINVLALSASPTLQNLVIDLLRGKRTHTQVWETMKHDFPSLVWNILRRK